MSRCKCFLESFESFVGGRIPAERNGLFQQIGDGNNDAAIISNKTSIEVGEPEEGLNVQYASRCRPGENRVNFDRVHADPFRRDDVAKKGDRLNVEFTFREFKMKARVLKTLKNQMYVSLVLLESVRVNKQVVEIGNHEIGKIFSEGVVDEVLKRARSIAKAKRHNLIFIKSISTEERCFPFIPSGDRKAIVSISHIESGEVFCFAQVANHSPIRGRG